MLVRKGQRRLDGLDAMIVSLYAGGMTIRDIQHHLVSTLGTGAVARDDQQDHRGSRRRGDQVAAPRTLTPYPVIYLDAIMVKVRDGGHVRNKAAHIAVGSTWTASNTCWGSGSQTEGAKFWASVCADLSNRGVADVLIVCCDGLTGFA